MARTTLTQTLLNKVSFGPSSALAATGGKLDLLANVDVAWADLISVSIVIHGTTGSPTSGNITAKWRLGERFADVADAQYSSRIFRDLETGQTFGDDTLTVGGGWPSQLADYTVVNANPVLVQRGLRPIGSLATVVLDASSLAGGTNPAFIISAAVTMKG